MVKELTGGYVIKYHANGLDKEPIEIDFTPPFRFVPCYPIHILLFFSLFLIVSYINTFAFLTFVGGLT